MRYRMSVIYGHPVIAATRALRFADHVTKRNGGSGDENDSARAEIPFRLHETSSDFLYRLAGLKILARFAETGLGFSARAKLRPGLDPSPCNRQFDFKRICFRIRAEISARFAGLKLQPELKFAM